MKSYYRPLAQTGQARPDGAYPLAGTLSWFTHVQQLSRTGPAQIVAARDIPPVQLERLTTPRPSLAGLDFTRPVIMGILNVTPDSFSDGGVNTSLADARTAAVAMARDGAHLLDIGGESTRPGAREVPVPEEIERVVPVVQALRADLDIAISVDTRKSEVARATFQAGADMMNDVSGFTFDPELAPFCAQSAVPVCIMHTQGTPQTMQDDPRYSDVLLDVYDFLEQKIAYALSLGIARENIIVDPGIGFGKTQSHNLAILRGISVFHGLGCPILLGASRKGFIREIGQAPEARDRMPGSVAVALAAVAQGVQVVRVHDVAQTRQALALWHAVTTGDGS
jgi:dihydropteroate synthase